MILTVEKSAFPFDLDHNTIAKKEKDHNRIVIIKLFAN
jgi:hypothetical protein